MTGKADVKRVKTVGSMLVFISAFLAAIRVFFRDRGEVALEVLALRQQLAVLKRKRPRPTVNSVDRLFWTALRRFWSRWTDVLAVVKPEPVVAWHRAGFRLYWRWRSRPLDGRPKIQEEIRALIRRMAEDNPSWRAPRIHAELQKLGFAVSERTVARYLRGIRRRGDPAKRWLAFLQNRREVTAAFDFFTAPTLTFSEAFPEASPYKYVILDNDSIFNADVATFLTSTGLAPKRTSIHSPWLNGTAERWVGSARREMLDHVIALNEQHLLRLIRDYVDYYHEDRPHDSLEKDAPRRRTVEAKPSDGVDGIALERVGGLHNRYNWHRAA